MTEDRHEELMRRAFLGEELTDQEQRELNQRPELQERLGSLHSLAERLEEEGATDREEDLRAILKEDPYAGEEAAVAAMRELMRETPELKPVSRLRWLAGGLVAAAAALVIALIYPPSSTPLAPGALDPVDQPMVFLGNDDFASGTPAGDTRLPLVFEFEYTGESSSMVEFGVVVRGLPELDPTFELESERSDTPAWTPNERELSQLPDAFLWVPVVYDDGEYEEGPATRVQLLRD